MIRKSVSRDPNDNWEAHIGGSYYGEEIHRISFNYQSLVLANIGKLLNCKSDKGMIHHVLKLEYGDIIQSVENCQSWKVETVKTKDIIPNKNRLNNLHENMVYLYKDHDLPRCILVFDGEKYRLVDGHHRFTSAKNQNHEEILAIIGR